MSKTTSAPAAPAKFIRPGKVVLLLNGRHAGKKAFIVNAFDCQRKLPFLFSYYNWYQVYLEVATFSSVLSRFLCIFLPIISNNLTYLLNVLFL